ncbi:MAG TPA: DUF5715 family protein [Longimicrobiales bacterium]|nr:DUF5715 family protein [Longimicrobiales bacterium]
MKRRVAATALVALLTSCTAQSGSDVVERSRDEPGAALSSALEREMMRLNVRADSIDAIFQPLPLLRPSDEAALQRFGNEAQLSVAARLGVPPNPAESELQRLVGDGRLVRLADSTEFWVVRRLDHSAPYLTPDAEALLRELARRFQHALVELDVPRFRLEITSALRTAQDQERLRRTNPNATTGRSTHQYGTTFDVAYSAFAAPLEGFFQPDVPEAAWLGDHLLQVASLTAETIAARRSRELMAILGRVLLELQAEGKVMVTLEQLQPVYHLTVARRLAGSPDPGAAP